MIWLGEERGFLSDWVTQQWVCTTGCRVDIASMPWLDGPVGNTQGIGRDFFTSYAEHTGLEIERDGSRGLIENFGDLAATEVYDVSPEVKHFYEHTSDYELDAWSEWRPLFQPFGRALAVIFSMCSVYGAGSFCASTIACAS
ncbi:MAG TPA: hypothetical protein VGD64_00430 [Acidisarcina sp.]